MHFSEILLKQKLTSVFIFTIPCCDSKPFQAPQRGMKTKLFVRDRNWQVLSILIKILLSFIKFFFVKF